MEGRRHSIDVPISRTLVALRRVKSLRDPSTNSMTKLSNLDDAIALGFENGCCVGDNDDDEDLVIDSEALMAMPSGDDWAEGMGSCNELDEVLNESEMRRCCRMKYKTLYRDIDESPRMAAGDVVMSRTGSPFLSINKAPNEGATEGMALYRNSDVRMMDFCHQGCGISSCWSRPTVFREPNHLHDEEQPLILCNAEQVLVNGDSEVDCGGVSPYAETPRNFCQKFTPKSFNELIGQKTLAISLISAIEKRQVASLYLFHGPRGTGKTSAARLFAAALNCLSLDNCRPCGLCQECVSFFSGRSRDIKEIDSIRLNRKDSCRLLVKSLRTPPLLSKFKVYIIDESHLLHREAWAMILNCMDVLSQRVVVVMVTPNLDKLPHSAVSRSQKYHFQKGKAIDVASRLSEICIQEGLEYDMDALNFISTKSSGSIRDALMMLDQISLLGRKITLSLVHEVNGFVSNDELLDLLHLALSSDASNTVKKARELLGSRIDPLQLISQLANLIMDILSEKCPDDVSDAKRKLFATHNSEADLQQLSYALKVLLQTEKQLRTAKNQTTWLTAALLQLSSTCSSNDVSDARFSVKTLEPQDVDFLSTSSAGLFPCEDTESRESRMQVVWIETIGMCTSSSIRNLLKKHGKLVSICITKGIAVAELEFDCAGYVSKAEKTWKVIAGALQRVLGYNVELRINLAENASDTSTKPRIISLFNCSRRMPLRTSGDTNERGIETCSSEGASQVMHEKEVFKSLRCSDGNALSIRQNDLGGSFGDSVERVDSYGSCRLDKPETKPRSRGCSKLCSWRIAMLRLRGRHDS